MTQAIKFFPLTINACFLSVTSVDGPSLVTNFVALRKHSLDIGVKTNSELAARTASHSPSKARSRLAHQSTHLSLQSTLDALDERLIVKLLVCIQLFWLTFLLSHRLT